MNLQNAQKLHDAGIQADMFGQPLFVDDYILAKGYRSASHNSLCKIKKVNKKSVVIDVYKSHYYYGSYSPRPDNHVGHWNFYPDISHTTTIEEMRRAGYDTIKIPKTFKADAQAAADELINNHPELLI